jgi:hypothetical protein
VPRTSKPIIRYATRPAPLARTALALSALPLQATRARARAIEHRLERLERKLEGRAWMPALFCRT